MEFKKSYLLYFTLAFFVSLIWLLISKDYYSYNYNFWVIEGIDLFPLVTWWLGLFSIYIAFLYLVEKLKLNSLIIKILFFLLFYWLILILAEIFGYHVLNVHNLPAANYSGLPICHCLHAPTWMKISYFLLGPIYFAIINIYLIIKKKHA